MYESEWRWSNILCCTWAHTSGCMVPVDISHVSKFPEPGREMFLSSQEFSNQIEAHTAQGHHVEQWSTAQSLYLELKPWRLPVHALRHQQLDSYSPGCDVAMSDVNWDTKLRCCICLGKCRLGDDDGGYIKGLWSIRMEN